MRSKKGRGQYAAPIAVAVLTVAFVGGLIALLFWAVHSDCPPLPVLVYLSAYLLLGLGVIFGVLWCLRQRIHEIQKGEEDEARKY
jgi:fatty acid desaturase